MDKAILKKFDQAIEKNPGLAEILHFYRDILKEQIKVANKQDAPTVPAEKEAAKVLVAGSPLVREWPVKVNGEQFAALFAKIGEIFRTHRPETAADITKIESELDLADYQKFIDAFAAEEHSVIIEKAKEIGVSDQVLSAMVWHSLRPFYIAHAEALRWLVKEELWAKSSCPICGTPGSMGKLDGEGGKRSLYCSLCDTVWKYKRLECPHCGADHESLRYLEIEGSKYQIDVCLKCTGYLKTLDARELSSQPYMLLEDLLTMDLDLLAQREGYTQDPDLTKQ